jgi:hypothetical protein
VQGDDAAAQPLVLQRLAQHARADDGPAVVREAEGAERAQLGHLRELAALEADGDRRHEAHGHAGVAGGGVAQGAQERRRVDHRARVRHRHDGAEAAGGRRARARLEVLLVLLARGAQVHVRIDEAGHEVAALAVDDLRAGRRLQAAGRPELGHRAVAHQDVVRRVEARARVQDMRAAHEQVDRGRGRADQGLHAGHPATPAAGRGRPLGARAGQDLVQDGHADDDARPRPGR